MSELIQEEKFISYENFIPNWTELVKEMDEKGIEGTQRMIYADNNGYKYSSCKQCLVGEGHKGNVNYVGGVSIITGKDSKKGCKTCTHMSTMPASSALTYGGHIFDSFKRTFYDHMIDTHPDLMVKRD